MERILSSQLSKLSKLQKERYKYTPLQYIKKIYEIEASILFEIDDQPLTSEQQNSLNNLLKI